MISPRQIAFRNEYRSRILGWYDGYFHIFIIYAMGAAAFYIYVEHIHDVTLLEWLTVAVLLALYWAGYKKLLASESISFSKVMLPVIPLVAISFFTIPYDSTDVFLYIDAGWAQAHYGLNPYSHTLRDVPNVAGDPIIQADWMQNNKNPFESVGIAGY